MDKIVRTIQRVSADEDSELHDDIVVPGITTLRHVTRDRGSNLGFAEEAQKKCQTLIPTLIRFVNPETASWITIKATVGLIRNITNNKKNRTYLR